MNIEEPRVGFFRQIVYGNSITALIRIFLGCLMAFSGWFKILDPETFNNIVVQYNLIPADWTPWVAMVLPVIEFLLGLLLILGIRIRASAFLSVLLMVVFTVAISINFLRGNTFECGCFELARFGIGIEEKISGWLILRDIIFCGAFMLILFAQQHVFSLESIRERIDLENIE